MKRQNGTGKSCFLRDPSLNLAEAHLPSERHRSPNQPFHVTKGKHGFMHTLAPLPAFTIKFHRQITTATPALFPQTSQHRPEAFLS